MSSNAAAAVAVTSFPWKDACVEVATIAVAVVVLALAAAATVVEVAFAALRSRQMVVQNDSLR